MQIITFFVVWCVIMKMLLGYESTYQKIRRMDNNPNCSIKSNKWISEHPDEYKKMKGR